MKSTVIALVPNATPLTVSVVATPVELFAEVIALLVGETVAFAGVPLATANVPVTLPLAAPDLTVAVNVFVPPKSTSPLLADNVIVGVALAIEQFTFFVPVAPSLHA